MSRRWRALAALAAGVVAAAALVAALAGQGGGGTAASPGLAEVGVNVNYVFNTLTYSAPQAVAIARTLAATGVSVARSDALWEASEPARGRHDPSFDDGVVSTLAAAGLRWLPIVDYAPAWARQDPALLHSPPADPASYAGFAAWLARRYGRGGSFWATHPALPARPVSTYEIWNEPDVPGFWSPAPSASAYARLYLAARAAIHAVDPQAVVLVGGLSNPPATLRALLGAAPELHGALDGVAIHPYGDSTAGVLDGVRRARATLDALGLPGVPLYVSEFGWVTSPSTAPHYVPRDARRALVRTTVDALGHTDCALAGEVLYTWITPQQNPADREQWYGIEPPADALRGVLSPAANALRAGVAAARAPAPRARVCG